MQIYIIFVFSLSSGAVSAGLEKVLRQAEFVTDIYQQFPHCYIFIINSEQQQQDGDSFPNIYSNLVFVVTEIC